MNSKGYVFDHISKYFVVLDDALSYWFTLNTSYNHPFHLSKQLGMGKYDYEALLIAANLAGYNNEGFYMIKRDNWKSFFSTITIVE